MPKTATGKTGYPYLTGTSARDPKWTNRAWLLYTRKKMRVTRAGDELQVSGACPRCGHPFTASYPLVVTTDRLTWPGRGGALLRSVAAGRAVSTLRLPWSRPQRPRRRTPHEFVFPCACTEPHEGRPADASDGCGIFFSLMASAP